MAKEQSFWSPVTIGFLIIICFGSLLLLVGMMNCSTIVHWLFPTDQENIQVSDVLKTVKSTVTGSKEKKPSLTNTASKSGTINQATAQVWAENLNVPWEIVWLPDQSALVTERSGRLLHLSETGKLLQAINVPEVRASGEGGLLGMALHPQFEQNRFIYLYQTTVPSKFSQGPTNQVRRYQLDLEKGELALNRVIVGGLKASEIHNGGRIAFDPAGENLYITVGDANDTSLAQNLNSLNGKILRVTAEGGIPVGNPWSNSMIYSYGHRNPQGLAWDAEGRLWATEHGPSFTDSGQDEINLIVAGGNYGWPTITGDQTQAGLITSVLNSTKEVTWAPAAAVVKEENLYFVGLKGESLYQAQIDGEQLTNLQTNWADQFGRLRVLAIGPDDAFYMGTSNRDGRGNPQDNDDKIIRWELN